VADEEELEEDGDEEEDASNNSDGESSLLQTACGTERRQDSNTTITSNNIVVQVGISIAIRGPDETRARSIRGMTVDPSNVRESTTECKVEEHAQHGEEGNATKTADQEDGNDGVEYCGAGNPLDGFDVHADGQAVVGQGGEVVGEDSDDDGCAAEFDDAQEHRRALESDTAKSHCDGWVGVSSW